MRLPTYVEKAINRIDQSGYEAYVVGGCVRDALRGFKPADWDICTSALPPVVQELFADVPCVLTGVQHGTVTVIMDGQQLEITTYRTEGTYSDARHPDEVHFVSSLREDLSRRDFTMNAMAYHPQKGLIDPFDGQGDLAKGLLRCVGNARERFREDALRILRGLRFASCFGFSFERDTADALVQEAQGLSRIARERVREELNRLLLGENVADVLLAFPSIITEIIPELRSTINFEQHSPFHSYTVYEHTVRSIAATQPILTVRLALLLHDIGKPATFLIGEDGNGHFYAHAKQSEIFANEIMQRLRYDRQTAERIVGLVRYHDAQIEAKGRSVKRWLNRCGEAFFRDLLMVQEGDTRALKAAYIPDRLEKIKQLTVLMEGILAEGQCFSLKDLAVNGNDIIALGIPAGKAVGELLNKLLEKVIEGDLPNEREALLEYARKNT